jgi:WD repeat-containing protein 13
MDSRTGALSRSHRHRANGNRKSPVTTVQYRTFSLLARGPVLLTFARDGSLSFFRLNWTLILDSFVSILDIFLDDFCCKYSVSLEIQGYLTLRCSLKLTPRLHSIRASFCPLLSLEKGEYIGKSSIEYFLSGTHDCHVLHVSTLYVCVSLTDIVIHFNI